MHVETKILQAIDVHSFDNKNIKLNLLLMLLSLMINCFKYQCKVTYADSFQKQELITFFLEIRDPPQKCKPRDWSDAWKFT